MRWLRQPPPRDGDMRKLTFFALWPVMCSTTRMVYWLELVTVEQHYEYHRKNPRRGAYLGWHTTAITAR